MKRTDRSTHDPHFPPLMVPFHLLLALPATVLGPHPSPRPFQSVHLTPSFIDAKQCDALIEAAEEAKGWDQHWELDQQRHTSYPTADVSALDHDSLRDVVETMAFMPKIYAVMRDFFAVEEGIADFDDHDFEHHGWSALDLFVVKYRHPQSAGLTQHRDGSLLSFSILLSDPGDFQGGGTSFASLVGCAHTSPFLDSETGSVRPTERGTLVCHSGKALHGATPVTEGTRYVLIGFVNPPLKPDVKLLNSGKAPHEYTGLKSCVRDWGRIDVDRYKLKRSMTRPKGSMISNYRYLSSTPGCFRKPIPYPKFLRANYEARLKDENEKRLAIEKRLLTTFKGGVHVP